MPVTLRPIVAPAELRDARVAERLSAFVREMAGATPFHLPAWSLGVERGCRQRSHYLVAEQGGVLAGVLPLTEVRSMLFGRAVVSAGFAVGGGVLATSDSAAQALADAAWTLAAACGCGLELRGGSPPAGEGWSSDNSTYLGFVRPLAADEAAELAAVPRKQRAEVRKALEMGFDVDVGRGPAQRRAHYRTYAESVRNLGTPVFPQALFAAMLDAFGGDADILTVRHQGRPVASVLSLYFGNTVYPYWGGGTQAARGLRANEAMYFALMNHARARGATRFDFGRSKAGTGPAAYKKNWGFAPEPLLYHKRYPEGAAPREINPLDPRYQRKIEAWKKLPLWAANAIGPVLSRGLG
ncbi:FemAB family PEP-CTERM system-associated protein [Sphingomonas aracearum]|uniref:FemAB family PEP-CTERM system-associated protein n=2 Tax=Sphingomonas aracearum TaxID=2283317 RepID=A0A369VY73_9SPHN|nr:FemAB family XrtA/PEP-CTERM system-associated protein [Sphingomonas aracearum]RDE06575.1 FemAB family PEP-CTERM system-associated protein [Sphingomonas aracearum]